MATYRSINSGRLRHRVKIQRPVDKQNHDTGEMTIEWIDYADRWAEYTSSSVRDFIAAGQWKSQVAGRFLFRFDPGLTAQMRIIHSGKVYAILGLLEDPDSGLEYISAPVSQGVIFDGR